MRLEGAARDLVRVIQDARKGAGYEIADRIKLYLSGLGTHHDGISLDHLVEQHGKYIKTETLTTELKIGGIPQQAHKVETELGGLPMEIGIERV